ncbi:MAG: dihydrolipoyl dehydrogenase [Nitriliruptorales bacterium]|nr:dihydrolipoyl dehydrogenase [Nitriliruptorales bacterium]
MAQEEVQLPQLGESVTEGIITEWLVNEGEQVEADQPLVEISTDKVDTEIPSPVSGVLVEQRAAVDDTVEVGDVIAVVDTEGEASGDEGDEEAEEAAAEETEAAEEPEEGATEGDEAGEEEPDEDAAPEPEEEEEEAPAEERPAAAEEAEKPKGKVERGDHDYDVVIIGAGTGGYSTALRAAQLDLDVAMIEKRKVGGTCLHWGCIPAKAILQTAEVAEHAQDAADYGVSASYEGIEVAALNEHKDAVVDKMYKGLQNALKGRGVETIMGTAKLTDAHTVEIDLEDGDSRTITGAAIVIATGSTPRSLPFADYDGEKVINSDHALYLEELPESAIILGSGAVGMEFATAWNAFGVETTVVELLDRMLPLEDKDVSRQMERAFKQRGINVMTGTEMTAVETTDSGVTCTVKDGDEEQELEAEVLLIAVGRAPFTEGLGLEDVGVETDGGFVVVDDYCRTSVDGIYALGDVIDTLGLAHASFAEGFLVADQLAGLDVIPVDYKGVPRVTYSHPEVGSVGYSEEDAKEDGFEVVVEKYPFQALARASMMNASGTVKIVAEKDDGAEGGAGRILGIHIVGPRATDLIAEGQLIYNWEALASDVAQYVHAHPTLTEAIGEAHLALAGRALHG